MHLDNGDSQTAVIAQPTQRRRGRPRKNGMKPPIALERAMVGIDWFDQARRRQYKYADALTLAARKTLSSTAEIKRALAEFRPRGCELGLKLGRPRPISPDEANLFKALDLPEGLWNNPRLKVFSFGSGPVPRHPRANARKRD